MFRRLSLVILASMTLYAAPLFAQCVWDCPGTFDPPSPGTSTIPGMIRVMGYDGSGAIDPSSEFSVTIRDLANNVLPNVLVTVDFSWCGPATICGLESSTCNWLEAAPRRVNALTDASGVARFRVAGCAQNPGGAPVSGDGMARLYFCGVYLGRAPAHFFDQNGDDGLGANDLSAILGDIGSEVPFLRSDYDGNGALGANDLSFWLGVAGTGRSALGCSNHP